MKTFFISHGHMDHAAGIPYIISQKAMHQHPAPVFYMPEDLVEPLEVIMQQWMKIENHQYQYHFKPLKAGDRVEVKPGFFVEALQTYHRVSSLAYCLIETKKKLKVQYSHLHGGKIAELKKNGVVVEDHSEKALFTFSGDTTSEFLKKSERARQSQILAIESTYVDQSKTIEHAKKWGHTHWDEILPMIPTLDCEKILVLHISSRYSTDYAQKKISEQLSSQDQERVVVFEGR
jgi:ribonuclease Z